MQYDAVIFDNDGVLARPTTRDVLREASRAAFEAVGVTDPATEHVERTMLGVTPADVREVSEAYGLDPEAFWAARDGAASDAQIAEMRAGRMARYDDVGALDRIRAPRGVVSTNQQATVDFALDHHGLSRLFETAHGREPTIESLRLKKPEPHYLERAMADLGAETALFVGDSETDVLAAERAGIDSAFVRRSHRADADFDATPTYEIATLSKLHAVDGVPLADAAADGGGPMTDAARGASPTVGDAGVPAVGLGTMGLDTAAEARAVTRALEMGYRHVDTAQIYGNEAVVGDAVAAADVPREEVFLATKVWADSLGFDDVIASTRESVAKLGVDALDLLYVHRPIDTYDPAETLPAFDHLREEGLVRHVGVSNFEPSDLETARDHLEAPIAAHQTEYHPLFARPELLADAREHGYAPVAYSPLAGGRVADVPEVVAVAEKHETTPYAVSLAWLRAKGCAVVPKASSESHLRANLEAATTLELDASDVARVDAVDRERELFPE